MLPRFATLGALAILLFGIGHAEGSQPSLRKLCIDAGTIVLAEPLDPLTPTRFKVILVMRGKDVRPDQTLVPAGLTEADVKTYDEKDLETGKPRPRRISRRMLFLSAGASSRLLPGGLRLCTEDGRVLVPTNGKPASEKLPPFEVQPRLSWQGLIERSALRRRFRGTAVSVSADWQGETANARAARLGAASSRGVRRRTRAGSGGRYTGRLGRPSICRVRLGSGRSRAGRGLVGGEALCRTEPGRTAGASSADFLHSGRPRFAGADRPRRTRGERRAPSSHAAASGARRHSGRRWRNAGRERRQSNRKSRKRSWTASCP